MLIKNHQGKASPNSCINRHPVYIYTAHSHTRESVCTFVSAWCLMHTFSISCRYRVCEFSLCFHSIALLHNSEKLHSLRHGNEDGSSQGPEFNLRGVWLESFLGGRNETLHTFESEPSEMHMQGFLQNTNQFIQIVLHIKSRYWKNKLLIHCLILIRY